MYSSYSDETGTSFFISLFAIDYSVCLIWWPDRQQSNLSVCTEWQAITDWRVDAPTLDNFQFTTHQEHPHDNESLKRDVMKH